MCGGDCQCKRLTKASFVLSSGLVAAWKDKEGSSVNGQFGVMVPVILASQTPPASSKYRAQGLP